MAVRKSIASRSKYITYGFAGLSGICPDPANPVNHYDPEGEDYFSRKGAKTQSAAALLRIFFASLRFA